VWRCERRRLRSGTIVEYRWHDDLDGALPKSMREEALQVLEALESEQLELWEK